MKDKRKLFIYAGLAAAGIIIIILLIFLLKGCSGKNQDGDKSIKTSSGISENEKTTTLEDESNEEKSSDESSQNGDGQNESSQNTESVSGMDKETDDEKNSQTTTEKQSTVNTGLNTIKKLHVSGAQLVDENGNQVQLKGISTHGLSWFPEYVNEKCFKQLHDEMGVQIVRLALYSAEYNGYCTGGNKSDLKQLVKNGVKYATENNMYVIIDWHIHNDNNPNTHKEEAKEFFAEMAKTYADYNNVFYEICNEPNGGTTWAQIKSYAGEVIKTIRKYDSDGIIIVGTPNWSQYVTQAASDPITGYDNIMYTLHFYAGTHKEELRNEMVNAINMGLPVFVTEYGICDASGSGGIDEYQANEWVKTLDKYGISYVAWNLSNKNETSAILKSSCKKTSGFTEGDLSDSGKWLMKTLKGTGNINSGNMSSDDTVKNTTSKNSGTSTNNSVNQGESDTTEAYVLIEASAVADKVNSWESNGRTFCQYNITVKNNTGKKCTEWTAVLEFDSDVRIEQGWGGVFEASGNKVYLKPAEYNSGLSPGQTVENIGLIISVEIN